MTKKPNQAWSFVIISVVYALATVLGVFIFNKVGLPLWLCLLVADVASTVLVFVFSLIFGNASVYDPYWSVQPMIILLAFVFDGVQLSALRILVLVVILFWGIRLTANWAYTFKGLEYQDWRYTMLHKKTGKAYPLINFVGIHLVPTLVVYGCILPAVYLFVESAQLNVWSVIFLAISLLSAGMQGIADVQMHIYKKNRTTKFINTGLWKYSRHPNYLGEILMWWGVALAVVCAIPQYWFLIAGALANTVLFLVVSIPMADGRQSQKEGYEEYKKATRALLPIKK